MPDVPPSSKKMVDVEVFFVATGDDKRKSSLQKTFESCQHAELDPKILDAGDHDKLQKCSRNAVYVFDAFQGDVFEYLRTQRFRVYGLPCVQECLNRGDSLPKANHPVYSFSMRNVVVCCTSLPVELRTKLHCLVGYMNGEVSRDFTEAVTHLVTLEVGSKKYEVAALRRLPILTPDWILASWQRCCDGEPVDALEPSYASQFKCPIFKGHVITVSGISNRKEVKELIERHGGTYTGEMKMSECTHLIVSEPKGQKYQFAKQWNIIIAKPEWLYDCVRAGYYLNEGSYAVSANQSSTPNKAEITAKLPAIWDISAINSSSAACANVTARSCVNSTAMACDPLDDIKVIKPGFFLEGCRIYMHGFSKARLEKVKMMINSSGAVTVSAITKSPSHVLTDDELTNANELASLLQVIGPAMPHVVSIAWLVDCVKQEKVLDAASYTIKDILQAKSEPIRKPLALSTEANAVSFARKTAATAIGKELKENGHIILGQHSSRSKDSSKLPNVEPEYGSALASPINVSTVTAGGPTNTAGVDNALNAYGSSLTFHAAGASAYDMSKTVNVTNDLSKDGDNLEADVTADSASLHGKTFAFRGFTEEDVLLLQNLVKENGGIVGSEPDSLTEYTVLPLMGFSEGSASTTTFVTVTWLQSCVEASALLPVESSPLFSPIAVASDASEPLAGTVISVSGFVGAVREAVYHVVQLLGGEPQESMAKKATGSLKATTHLIVAEPAAGRKYEAAKTWGIPTLSLSWLLDCARFGHKQREADYGCSNSDAASSNHPHRPSNASAAPAATTDLTAAFRENPLCALTSRNDEHLERSDGAAACINSIQLNPQRCEPQTCATAARLEENQCSKLPENCSSNVRRSSHGSCDAQPAADSVGESAILWRVPNQPSGAKPASSRLLQVQHGSTDFSSSRQVGMTPRTKSRELGIDTPSKWLNPNVSFHPGFDLGCVAEASASPATGGGCASRRSSLPMEDLLESHLRLALEVQRQQASPVLLSRHSSGGKRPAQAHSAVQQSESDCLPLAGVVALFGRQLLEKEQAELGSIVVSLGGKWHCGATSQECTHYVSSLRPGSDELKQVNMESAHFVSPQWLRACHDATARVDERSYPCELSGMYSPQHASPALPQPRRSARLHADVTCKDEVPGSKQAAESEMSDRLASSASAAAHNALSDQLQSFISTTKRPRYEKRKGRKRILSSTDEAKLSVTGSRDSYAKSSAVEAAPDPSQPVQIMWDDTISRLETEKLADHLDRASCPMDDGCTIAETIKKLLRDEQPLGNGTSGQSDHGSVPVDAVAVKDCSSPAFLLSGLSSEERDSYAAVIRSLGGQVLDSPSFDSRCTHLVVGKPTRNEKFLACIATGKWVLHPSYFEACHKAGAFVDERPHEWGGSAMAALCQQLGDATAKLAAAAHRRRVVCGGGSRSAFASWQIILCTEEAKENGFRRLLEAGGAVVVATRPPFVGSGLDSVTHAFVDLRRTDYSVTDFEPLLRLSVPCLKPDYIASYLTEEALPNLNDYQVPELLDTRVDTRNAPDSRRRRISTAASAVTAKKPR